MRFKSIIKVVLFSYILLGVTSANAVTERDKFKRIHDRIAGIHPDEATLQAMENACTSGYTDDNGINHPGGAVGSAQCYEAASYVAIDNPRFYNTTLKNMVAPWTNEAQSVVEPLNDYSATIIGIVRDNLDFRRILTDNIIYTVGNQVVTNRNENLASPRAPYSGIATFSPSSNQHYIDAENNDVDLEAYLARTTQSSALGIPANAAAGIMTTRAAAKAFYIDGTNRAMFRFTILNHFCNDLEFYKDGTRPSDRIRQDVSRSPGGDSRIYLNNCIGCHAGMDGLAGAFAYYNYEYDPDVDPDAPNGLNNGIMSYKQNFDPEPFTGHGHKYLINAENFKWGYETTDDSWVNYWRNGPNINIGWDINNANLPASGNGAASLGAELANTNDFASCQVKKVFKTVCLRSPVNQADRDQVASITSNFISGSYNLKRAFVDSANYCLTPSALY
ncbi:MAG: hypothetical protein P8Y24_09160 [Gammaproteobacteria bacterium]